MAGNNVLAVGMTRYLGGLWSRNFGLYFAGRSISLFGDSLLPVALIVGVVRAGYGAEGIGYAMAAWMTPIALLVLFGGVLADRFTARKMMVGADLARMVVQCIMAIDFTAGRPALWQIAGLLAVSGAGTAMFQPGMAGIVRQVAPDAQRANATLRTAEAVLTATGPAVAGVLVATASVGTVFAIDSGSYGASAACLLALRLSPLAAAAPRTTMWRNLAVGWREFLARTWLWSVIAIWAVYGLTVFGPAVPLNSSLIVPRFGSSGFGVVMSAYGAGTVLGGLLGLWLRPARPVMAGAMAMTMFSLYPFAVAVALPVPGIAVAYLLAGMGFAFWNVMWATTMQTQIPPHVLNRVAAYDIAGSAMILPVGQALAGPMAHLVGARHVLFASAGIGLSCCAAMLAIPAIRNLRRVAPATPPATTPAGSGAAVTGVIQP